MKRLNALASALLIALAAVVLNSCSAGPVPKDENSWLTYNNPGVGFSLEYPPSVTLLDGSQGRMNPEQTYIEVVLRSMGESEAPMELTAEEEQKTVEALHSGEFGLNHDFILEESKKVRPVGFLFTQDYMVLARFEVCDITLERSLVFFFNNNEIKITLHGPIESLKESMPEFFTVNEENCGSTSMWDLERHAEFYSLLTEGNGSTKIQNWFDQFDEIVETITFAHR